jgi:hypothetical protein
VDLATLQKMHPQWNIVDWKEGPQGQGIIALGKDGGVFALDATGGTTGTTAPLAYAGGNAFSYTTLAPEQRQANTPFTSIDVSPNGYILRNANQQQYSFGYPAVDKTSAPATDTTGTTQATDTSPGANNTADVSGSGAIHAVLDPLGLGSIAAAALEALHKTPNADAAYITQVWLPAQPEYQKLFPEIKVAQDKAAADPTGRTHIPTPAEITAYRQSAQTMATQGIIPAEFVTNDQIGKLINGGVSLGEFQSRVTGAITQLEMAPQSEKDAFFAYHPAVDFSHAVGALLDPTLSEAAVNRSIAQARVGGFATSSGFGSISAAQADTLAAAGHGTEAEFAGLQTQKALYNPLVGETNDVTKQTALAGLTNTDAAQTVVNRNKSRQALFGGGGGVGSGGSRGEQGLGAAGQ